MKQIINSLTFVLIALYSFGQDYKSQFNQSLKDGDTSKQIELLTNWEKETPNDPELFPSYFNYYFLKSKQEIISISSEQPSGETLQVSDSSGQVSGFLGSQTVYDLELVQKGLDKINIGIEKYPNRLDMRFGKIYVLGQIEDWESFTNEIKKTIRYSQENDNSWTWSNNKKKENGKEFFLTSIQDYQITLFETEDDALLKNMRSIAEEVIKFYPNHIESLTNISITYVLEEDYEEGIDILLKAEQLAPKDGVILSNIAHAYNLNGNANKAIIYYEKMLDLENPNAVEYAKQQIETLKE
nr:tetratricopeptide repeat protein [uncultured Brumimicrobium sp.]